MANKTVNGKQLTVVWHVDDLKISHNDANVVTSLIDKLNKTYGTGVDPETPLTVRKGKKHSYLGMILDYTEKGKVKIDMTEYIQEVLAKLSNEYDGTAITPAASHLFEVNDECKKLDHKQQEEFHHVVAQLIFLCIRNGKNV